MQRKREIQLHSNDSMHNSLTKTLVENQKTNQSRVYRKRVENGLKYSRIRLIRITGDRIKYHWGPNKIVRTVRNTN